MNMKKPDCYQCKYREEIPGDAHSRCGNKNTHVKGDKHGIKNGWFSWPFNFDPIWLKECDGFIKKQK